MTKKPDYTDRNPKVLVTVDGEFEDTGIHMAIYDAEGTPVPFTLPTDDELIAYIKGFLATMPGVEMRMLTYVAEQFETHVKQCMFGSLSAAHAMAHSPDHNAGYDEHILCDGVHAYLADPQQPKTAHVTPETVADHVLKNFFPDKEKPN